MELLEKDTPNFIFNNANALVDYGCIIENELPEITAQPNISVKKIPARSRELHIWHNDYLSYDLPVKDITIPYENFKDVIRWLRGSGKLITHNDPDKYRDVFVSISKEQSYENEWGVFYTFDLTFECQPFKKKIYEEPTDLEQGENIIVDNGMEPSSPYFEFTSTGGDITITIENKIFKLLATTAGSITLDCEMGLAVFDGSIVKTQGEYPKLHPGENSIILDGAFSSATILKRSVWL
ncbi:phage tail protein [Carnobacterium maltaromaticum]|uniref:phage tail protein n=1 Tax=Carnobacterium maltaromaticum TaxID=2751 RepID=UPI00191BAA85|nr:phage tail protein [Carnobacterium maltaromaticum]CAD5902457.1 conserved hypothetical protein [Carnobacterium maltaromaticum]